MRGPTVHLRPPRMADLREFLTAVRQSRNLHRGWVSPPSSPASFRAYLNRTKQDDFRAFLACNQETGAIAGVITVSQIYRGPFQSAYLGFYAMEGHQGHGLMREALGLTLRAAFGQLKLHRLEANVQPANARSIALVKSLGFRLEGFSPLYLKIAGRWRDHERWAILREQFERTSGG
jgi:[ribosomal protein S5]-alanine N-acetyltransferase